MEEAERYLGEASSRGRTGRFQLEAAIQSVHAERARSGKIQWNAVMLFYEQLIRISPTLGTRTGYAAAVAEAKGAEAALAALDAIAPDDVSAYQPYWAVRAHVLQRLLSGILDLTVAVSIGALVPLLAPNLYGAVSTAPMTQLPLVLIPTYLVPTFLILHLTALFQARRLGR
jgi:hypothetical protein